MILTEPRRIDLLCMGRVCVDLYSEQSGARLEDVRTFRKYVGGSAANIAIGASRLGLKAALLTRLGDEAMGTFVKDELTASGVDVSAVSFDRHRLTGIVLLAIRESDDFPRLFLYENAADMAIEPNDVDGNLVSSAQALLVTGSLLARDSSAEALRKAVDIAKSANSLVVLDIDYRPVLWGLTDHRRGGSMFVEDAEVTKRLKSLLPACDVVVGTEDEMRIAGGDKSTTTAVGNIRELSNATLIIKRGAAGSTILAGDLADPTAGVELPALPIEVSNPVGAGDAFLAGFLRGLLKGENSRSAAEIGNTCGAIVASRHGCSSAMPSWDEVRYVLDQKQIPRQLDQLGELRYLHSVARRHGTWPTLYVLALDHRWQLEEMVDEAGAERGLIRDLKSLLVEAFDSVANDRDDVGILLDDEYAAQHLEALARPGAWVGRPIERPKSRPVEFSGGPDLASQLLHWPVQHVVKCLVHQHPEDPKDLRATQEGRLLRLFEACLETEHELLIEIQPPEGSDFVENEVIQVIEGFYRLGIRPSWWKLPPALNPSVWRSLGNIVQKEDPHCRGILILGKSSSVAELQASFAGAASQDVCPGFAVGRAIFAEPARAWLMGQLKDADLVKFVADNYRNLISIWEAARGATLAPEPGSPT